MCGIAGKINIKSKPIRNLNKHLKVMNQLQAHRGPDGQAIWIHKNKHVGFAHRRLSIIDLVTGDQPMTDNYGNTISFNGEIYNYIELKDELKASYSFKTTSDTEVILAAYKKWGTECVRHLRGMFAFAIWDEKNSQLFCARDRFGIKPFYYTRVNNEFIFASEPKALLPFLDEIRTDLSGLKDYFIFQFCLGEKTLFKNIIQLLPAHYLLIKNGSVKTKKYWEVNYILDFNHQKKYFQEKLQVLLEKSVQLHLRSDVPVGAYLSGGIDSSLIATLLKKFQKNEEVKTFHGNFSLSDYNESKYAQLVAKRNKLKLYEIEITSDDFIKNIKKIIFHLDYPIAGPGSFPQYRVSQLTSKYVKVVLGGQGGDEIFGGYVRYLLAYFEQCIKGTIDGTMSKSKFIVTYESIIPNLIALKNYKPLMQEFWKEELFAERDRRYFRLINRGNNFGGEINWQILEPYSSFKTFQKLFWANNVHKDSYFDRMTHFDFKTLLPILLHVEDRMSMAHGLEARVPFLDHQLIEFIATVPAVYKFAGGDLKHLLKTTFRNILPKAIVERKDKMGFPVPLTEWLKTDLREFITDIFSSKKAKERDYLNSGFDIHKLIKEEGKFSRKLWGFLSLELWQQEFHDKNDYYRKLI